MGLSSVLRPRQHSISYMEWAYSASRGACTGLSMLELVGKNKLLAKKVPDKESIAKQSRRLEAKQEDMFHTTDEAVFTTQ